MEALEHLEVSVEAVPAPSAQEFLADARDADALFATGARISGEIIAGMTHCKVIANGGVGVDAIDVAAATARGIPVTNVPDTFIEEVADHAMTLLLAGFRRLVVQDQMVREGRWAKAGRRSTSSRA